MAMTEPLPELWLVRQRFQTPREADVAEAVRRELTRLRLAEKIRPGDSVALTAGSRGIADIVPILRATVAFLRGLGAEPFIIPAMGSHGGGTAEGQEALLAGYGIDESSVGAPIRSSIEVVEVGRHPAGGPIYLDRLASQADHIGVVARVKPHTSFVGSIESGLVKMMMIGLGKHEGAKEYHRVLVKEPWEPFVRSVAPLILESASIRFGLGIIENALDQTARIEGVRSDDFLAREPALLEEARQCMARLPVDELDLLIIDEIGKDISGAGADTNVMGRKNFPADSANGDPRVQRIYVRGLSKRTQGNATGIGLADFTSDRLIQSMNYETTVINCLTANHPLAAAIPVHFANDALAINAALSTVGLTARSKAKIAWIENTLQLEWMAITTGTAPIRDGSTLDPVRAMGWPFGDDGNLPSLSTLIESARAVAAS